MNLFKIPFHQEILLIWEINQQQINNRINQMYLRLKASRESSKNQQ